jgi:hypothetical protein
MRRWRPRAAVVAVLLAAIPFTASASPPAPAPRSGAFSDSEAFILGTVWSTRHAFHVAIYRERQPDVTRAVVERQRRDDGVVDAADDETLAADSLVLRPHPERPGLHLLTFKAALPGTGTWDLSFSGRLGERNYSCLHGAFTIRSMQASTNPPSRSSTIAGDTVEAQSQCFHWGGAGTGTYSTPWASARPPLAFGF